MKEVRKEEQQGLYRREFEHDNCGIGAVVNIKGKKTHETVANALRIVEHLEHRAGKDAEGETGDGVGILLQISHKFFKKVCKKEGFDIGGEREYGIAQLFFPQHEIRRAQAKKMFEIILEKEEEKVGDEDYIEEMIAKRAQAKKDRDFAMADQIRDELAAKGIVLKDTREGVKWSRA